MDKLTSNYFNAIQLASLQRIGNVYAPGNGCLPRFSDTGCIEHVDDVLESVEPEDVVLLGVLLLVLRFVPLLIINGLVSAMNNHHRYPEPIAGLLRLISLGLKGVIMSLYYSGLSGSGLGGSSVNGSGSEIQGVHDAMGYSLHCESDS